MMIGNSSGKVNAQQIAMSDLGYTKENNNYIYANQHG
jgi:hypothetical protein